jgi:hypothetical protein
MFGLRILFFVCPLFCVQLSELFKLCYELGDSVQHVVKSYDDQGVFNYGHSCV